MRKEPPLPQDVWDLIPAPAQAAVIALVESLQQQILALTAQMERLSGENAESTGEPSEQPTETPPTSTTPPVKRSPPQPPSGKKPGGQPGHPGHRRTLWPRDKVKVIPCHPTACRRCGHALTGDDPEPVRHQVFELPVIPLDCTEYELHRLTCPHCGKTTCAELPADVPHTTVGPRLQAFLAMLSGGYRMSKRMIETLCDDLFGWSISLGQICRLEQDTAEVLETPVGEARAVVPTEPANVDSTGWRLRGRSIALWVAVTSTVTVFRVLLSRGADAVRELVGATYRQVLTSDRAKCFLGYPRRLRQVCWAHLRRDFQAMIDRGGPGARIGKALLGHSDVLFAWWYRIRDGTLARSTFHRDVMNLLRPAFRADLEAGLACGCAKTAGTCREMLKLEQSLWTFVRHDGIEPTNNDAERPFRHGVQWRKTSYGSMSDHGMQFVANILTVIATCRRHGRNVLEYLTACCAAANANRPAPSLLLNK